MSDKPSRALPPAVEGSAARACPATPRAGVGAVSPQQTLRRLFLTLFLRGRSSRGLRRETAPKSVGSSWR